MSVAQNQAGGVYHEVQVAIAVDVVNVQALPVVDEGGVGGEEGGAPGAAAGQILQRLLLKPLGVRRAGYEFFGLNAQAFGGHRRLLFLG